MDVIDSALRHLECAGAHVEEGRTAVARAVEGHAAEEVVLFLLQHPFAEGHAGRKYFRDTAFDQFVLGQLRVFQLVADGHLVARAHEAREILLDGVMRHPCHGHLPFFAVAAVGLDQPQYLAHQHGVVGVGLIEIPHPVEQDGFGVLRLDGEVLPEHGGIFQGFGHILQI